MTGPIDAKDFKAQGHQSVAEAFKVTPAVRRGMQAQDRPAHSPTANGDFGAGGFHQIIGRLHPNRGTKLANWKKRLVHP
jgi:hypothetical protein